MRNSSLIIGIRLRETVFNKIKHSTAKFKSNSMHVNLDTKIIKENH